MFKIFKSDLTVSYRQTATFFYHDIILSHWAIQVECLVNVMKYRCFNLILTVSRNTLSVKIRFLLMIKSFHIYPWKILSCFFFNVTFSHVIIMYFCGFSQSRKKFSQLKTKFYFFLSFPIFQKFVGLLWKHAKIKLKIFSWELISTTNKTTNKINKKIFLWTRVCHNLQFCKKIKIFDVSEYFVPNLSVCLMSIWSFNCSLDFSNDFFTQITEEDTVKFDLSSRQEIYLKKLLSSKQLLKFKIILTFRNAYL